MNAINTDEIFSQQAFVREARVLLKICEQEGGTKSDPAFQARFKAWSDKAEKMMSKSQREHFWNESLDPSKSALSSDVITEALLLLNVDLRQTVNSRGEYFVKQSFNGMQGPGGMLVKVWQVVYESPTRSALIAECGPVYTIHGDGSRTLRAESEANARMVAETFQVFHERQLSPKALVEQIAQDNTEIVGLRVQRNVLADAVEVAYAELENHRGVTGVTEHVLPALRAAQDVNGYDPSNPVRSKELLAKAEDFSRQYGAARGLGSEQEDERAGQGR
jgi:hypothetical protein